MLDYIELMKNTALLKVALSYINNDADDCIETFKQELQEQIDKNEKEMEDFDKWLTIKEQEAEHNVD